MFDLWRVLYRRRGWAVTCTILGVVAGIAVSLSRTPIYRYSTAIEIGSYPSKDGNVLVESPKSVVAKIMHVYRPVAIDKLQSTGSDENVSLGVSASVPVGGQFVVLSSYGPAGEGNTFRKLHHAILEQIRSDHDGSLNAERQKIEVQLAKGKNKLDDLEEQDGIARERLSGTEANIADQLAAIKERTSDFQAQLKRTAVQQSVLESQEKGLHKFIGEAEKEKQELLRQKHDADAVLMLLLVGNGMRHDRSTLAALQERIAVEMPNRRDDLERKIEAAKRQQGDLQRQLTAAKLKFSLDSSRRKREQTMQRMEITNYKTELGAIRSTHALVEGLRSKKPIGPNRMKYPILTGLVGLGFGVLLAFAFEIVSQTRKGRAA